MFVRILGSAAGGRFPQWNCACPNCADVRRGDPALTPRTQDSIAVSADGERFFLFNCPADVLEQIQQTPALHPRGPRHSPIAGVLVGNGDLDHVLGLFCLRESQPLSLHTTERVRADLADRNAMYRTLQRFEGHVTWKQLVLDQPFELTYLNGERAGLTVTAFAAPGKRPLHLMHTGNPSPEDNVGFAIEDAASGRTCVYLTAAGSLSGLEPRVANADCVLFDGTFWSESELIDLGLGTSRARDMAHWPIGGPDGSLARLQHLNARRIYTHINNTNPILRTDSNERRAVEAAGWEVAHDGLELEL
ncbi:MAG: pyrroloquinoline quinone biosynthesis protein PqqB [Myxococcales bacterium]|nr:pyrroloquinoline quinone biosynthesis protein PqqB [Myxococcales bacterium]MDD9971433.1 pyrroloquinoline quinone biosynthesis protein PqqB [Myxococcales bacterium]